MSGIKISYCMAAVCMIAFFSWSMSSFDFTSQLPDSLKPAAGLSQASGWLGLLQLELGSKYLQQVSNSHNFPDPPPMVWNQIG